MLRQFSNFEPSNFEFVSNFELRVWDFPVLLATAGKPRLVRAVTEREASRQELGRRDFYRFCRNQGSAGPLSIEIGAAEAWWSHRTTRLPKIQAGPARFLYALPRESLDHAVARSRCPKSTLVRASTYRFFRNRGLVTPALLASGVGPRFSNAARIDFVPAERFRAVVDSARAVGQRQ